MHLPGAECTSVPYAEWFACVLARARVAGRGGEVAVRAPELLAGPMDGDRFQIVGTGGVSDGAWHLATRGICLEFMLRLEIMGPQATSIHPRPGDAWEPVVNVGCARRLMARMLAESGVTVRFGAADGLPAGDHGGDVQEKGAERQQRAEEQQSLSFHRVLPLSRAKMKFLKCQTPGGGKSSVPTPVISHFPPRCLQVF